MSGFKPTISGKGPKPTASPPKISQEKPSTHTPPTKFTTRPKQTGWTGWTTALLILGLLGINVGIFFSPDTLESITAQFWKTLALFDFRYWSKWTGVTFFLVLAGLLTRYFLTEQIEFGNHHDNFLRSLRQLRRIVTILIIGVLLLVCCTSPTFSGMGTVFVTSFLPVAVYWMFRPIVWVGILLALVISKIIVTLRSNGGTSDVEKPVRAVAEPSSAATWKIASSVRSGTKIMSTKEKGIFSSLQDSAAAAFLLENKARIGLGIAVLFGIFFLFYLGNIFFASEWIDEEGFPISKPWWMWVLPFLALAIGGVITKIVIVIRAEAASVTARSVSLSTPRKKTPPPQSKGFNVKR